MLETKPFSLFFKYVIPSILGLLAISSASIVDGYFVGNYVNSTALAAINISYPITTVLFGFALMFAVGSSVMLGKLMGEKNLSEALNIFSKSLISIFFASIIICFLLFFSIGFILDILNVQNELRALTLNYLPILLMFLPFLMVGIVLDYFVRVDENPNLSFFALLLSSLINVLLDYIFIVKLSWGIEGAAYATGISQALIILFLLPHFFLKKATLKFIKPIGSWKVVLNACKNGFSEFINEASTGITVLIFNYVLLLNFGANGVAAYTIVGYLIMLSVMISFAISDALQGIISKNYGAKYFLRIKSFLKLGFSSILIIEIILSICIILFPENFVDIFLDSKAGEAKQLSLNFLFYLWPAFIFAGLSILMTSYLTSIHKAGFSANIAIFRSLVFPITLIFLLPLFLGDKSIFIVLPLSEFFSFLLALSYFLKFTPKTLSTSFDSA